MRCVKINPREIFYEQGNESSLAPHDTFHGTNVLHHYDLSNSGTPNEKKKKFSIDFRYDSIPLSPRQQIYSIFLWTYENVSTHM